jgi:hypothetical protein
MRPLELAEIKSLAEYEAERAALRPRMMERKARRRIHVGDHLTFLFENRETVRYQIQEMIRIERITRPEDIAHEVKTYNELIPGLNELSASLLIEFETPDERQVWLRRLLGLENHVWLTVEGFPPSKARFDTRQIATDRLSSVQYVKFPLTPEQVAHFRQGVRIIVDHPDYLATRQLSSQEVEELAGDLS